MVIKLRTKYIIHIFALLHFAASIVTRLMGVSDTMVLTVLTVAMTLIICIRKKLAIDFAAASLIFVNGFGFIFGNLAAKTVLYMLPENAFVYASVSLITTEIIGWSIVWLVKLFGLDQRPASFFSGFDFKFLIIAAVTILALRFTLDNVFTIDIVGLSWLNLVVLCMMFMLYYALSARSKLAIEKEKVYYEQFRYLRLKQQMNPHFLFNSLNILDCMVKDGENEKASSYISQLALIYRYMISNEENQLVTLSREMEFANAYISLLQTRFGDALKVESEIDRNILGQYVVPSAVQLLVENATKHNSFSVAEPLTIRIQASKDRIRVENNLSPKNSKSQKSTRLGLSYLRKQYENLCSKGISVTKADGKFVVEVPLLDNMPTAKETK